MSAIPPDGHVPSSPHHTPPPDFAALSTPHPGIQPTEITQVPPASSPGGPAPYVASHSAPLPGHPVPAPQAHQQPAAAQPPAPQVAPAPGHAPHGPVVPQSHASSPVPQPAPKQPVPQQPVQQHTGPQQPVHHQPVQQQHVPAEPAVSAPFDGRPPRHAVLSRKIIGLPPILFVLICLLALVALVTIVLVFAVDVEAKTERVVVTLLTLGAFTGLLMLDMVISRRSIMPLVIGSVANLYILSVMMLVTWLWPQEYYWILGGLLLNLIWITLAVRVAALLALWAVTMGSKFANGFLKAVSITCAALLGLAVVGLTLPAVMAAFNFEPASLYWQFVVSFVILAGLTLAVTVIVYWSLNGDAKREREALGVAEAPLLPPPVVPGYYTSTTQGSPVAQQPGEPWAGGLQGGYPVPQHQPAPQQVQYVQPVQSYPPAHQQPPQHPHQ